ncbi:hypothetical protein INT46_008737, partial [Mucor plumbeus]
MSDNNSLSWAEMASRHGEVRYFQQTKRRHRSWCHRIVPEKVPSPVCALCGIATED